MITIIDYGLGNIGSVANTLARLDQSYQISSDAAVISSADALILPGVGAAGAGMKNLQERGLIAVIQQYKKPLLGICLGMQLLFENSEEGNTSCLGILKGSVKKFQTKIKVPQIGWNEVKFVNQKNALFQQIPNNSYFYFVNSYYCQPVDTSVIAATSEYGERFTSIVATKNIIATQFHPEKSGDVGMQLLRNFWEEVC